MTLSGNVDALAARVAAEFKTVRTEIGAGSGGGGGSALPTRTTATYTTASLATGATEVGSLALQRGYRLLRITTNRPARVRLYATVDQRTADSARPLGIDPEGDHGLMLEFLSTPALLGMALSPLVDGFSNESTPANLIPLSIQNADTSTGAVTVTLVWIGTE